MRTARLAQQCSQASAPTATCTACSRRPAVLSKRMHPAAATAAPSQVHVAKRKEPEHQRHGAAVARHDPLALQDGCYCSQAGVV